MWKLFNLEEQYAQHPEIKREEVQKLLQWIQTQPHLPLLTEHETLLFFAAAKYSVEATKQLIDINLTCRTHFDEFFGDYDVESPRMSTIMKTIGGINLPKSTADGCSVVLAKLLNEDAAMFNFTDTLKLYFMAQDIIPQEIGVVTGFILIIDLTGATFAHVTKVILMQLKRFLYYLQEAGNVQLKAVHFINIVPFVDKIVALVTPFLTKELSDKLYVHANIETLYEYIPIEMMPQEYGGTELHSKVLSDKIYKQLRENRLELMEFNSSRRINEKLRPAQMERNSDIFGTEGNFKKLDID